MSQQRFWPRSWFAWGVAMVMLSIGFAFMPDGPFWREFGAMVCICAYAKVRDLTSDQLRSWLRLDEATP